MDQAHARPSRATSPPPSRTASDTSWSARVAPNRLHFEIGQAVLESGKHLLLEKPMALSVADCDRLIEQAGKECRVLAIGHELRLSSLWGGAKRLIDEGVIGEPRHVLVELSRFPYRQGSGGWR